MMRCNVREDPQVTLSRFRTSPHLELQKELIPHQVTTLDHTYQMAQELERYLNPQSY